MHTIGTFLIWQELLSQTAAARAPAVAGGGSLVAQCTFAYCTFTLEAGQVELPY